MRVMFIFTNSWWPNRGGYQSCIILDDISCCLLVIVLIYECDQPQQPYILFVPQLANILVVDPQLGSAMQYGITFPVNTSWWSFSVTTIAHLALTWEWQSFTQSSKGSVSQTILPVSSTKMSHHIITVTVLWCGCAAQLSLVIALWMELLNYTCSHVKVYFTALPWLKYHWLTLHRHHFIVKGRVKLFTAYKQNYEHQGAFVKVRKGR